MIAVSLQNTYLSKEQVSDFIWFELDRVFNESVLVANILFLTIGQFDFLMFSGGEK